MFGEVESARVYGIALVELVSLGAPFNGAPLMKAAVSAPKAAAIVASSYLSYLEL